MKNTRLILITITYYLLTITFLSAQSAHIIELSGTVELKPSGSSSFIPASLGDTVSENTLISTGFKSSALIEAGSAIIAVRPLTRLTLTEISSMASAEIINLNLQAGRVRVDVSPPAGTRASMKVSTPTATASVRGTSFEMDTRRLSVIEGKVGYSSEYGNIIFVGSGYDSAVLSDGTAADPHASVLAGYPPSAPSSYDPRSAPSIGGGGTGLFIPSPGSPGGPSGPGGNGGPSGPSNPGGPGTPGPSSPGSPSTPPGGSTGSDGDIGGINITNW
jgi:hypothetical protein